VYCLYAQKISVRLIILPVRIKSFNKLRHIYNQRDAHFTFTYTLLRFTLSTCFLPIFRRHYTKADLVTIVRSCRCGLAWDQPTSKTTHNNHQICFCVVPPEDGQVIHETCWDSEPQQSVSESKACIKLVVYITSVSMMQGEQNINFFQPKFHTVTTINTFSYNISNIA
jgi:hypothetical protein